MKCSTEGCGNPATFRYYWVGWESACEPCIKRVLWMAEAFGVPTIAPTVERIADVAAAQAGEGAAEIAWQDPDPPKPHYVSEKVPKES